MANRSTTPVALRPSRLMSAVVHPLGRAALGAGAILLYTTIAQATAPSLGYLFPAGAQRGTTITVTAHGEFPNWPVSAWVDSPWIQVRALEEEGQLELAVSEDAPPGRYWLRLVDGQGASEPRPLFVGTVAEIEEEEPNDEPSQAQPVELPVTVNGRLQRAGDVDGFAVELNAGDVLVASVEANFQLGSPMDAVMQIATPEGFVLAQHDDERGLDPMLVFDAPEEGTYVVRVFAFPATPTSAIGFAGGPDFVYRLTLTRGPFLDFPLPLAVSTEQQASLRPAGWSQSLESELVTSEPRDAAVRVFAPDAAGTVKIPLIEHPSLVAESASTAERLKPPVTVSGVIEQPDQRPTFRFASQAGQRWRVQAESHRLGLRMDPALRIMGPDGNVVAEEDDTNRQPDPELVFEASEMGEYRIELRDEYGHAGSRHAWRLQLSEAEPDFRLQLAEGTFTVSADATQQITVEIERLEGFDGPIELQAVDLPEGIMCAPVKVDGDAGEAVLALEAAAGASSGPFRVIGHSSHPSRHHTARFALSQPAANLATAWVTVLEQ